MILLDDWLLLVVGFFKAKVTVGDSVLRLLEKAAARSNSQD